MGRSGLGKGILAAVGVTLLALLVVPAFAAPAGAAPVTVAGSSTQKWAYGAEKWFNATIILPNATYTQHAFFGWHVIITATNTSALTQAWEVQRTMAGSIYADYCQPNCSAPKTHGNLSVTGWETDAGFANLTLAASVYENGSKVPAFGIDNASFENAANLSTAMKLTVSSGSITGSTSASFTVGGSAHGSVGFSPALGLVPLNVSKGAVWNSSSAFSSSGAWKIAYLASRTSFSGSTSSSSGSATGSVNLSGLIAVEGRDLGNVTLDNGLTVPVIALVVTGPFDDVDGVILIPHDFDIFGGGAHGWASGAFGSEAVSTSNLDVQADESHHMRLVAAAATFGSSQNAFASVPAVTGGGGVSAMASPGAPSTVQAQPESVASAQQASACLMGKCVASISSRGLASLGVAVLLVGLIAAALAAAIVVTRRRGRQPGINSAAPGGGAPRVAPPAGALVEQNAEEPATGP